MASATRKLYLVAIMICATSLRCGAFSTTSACSSSRVADQHIMSNSPTTPRTGRGCCGSPMEMQGRNEDGHKRRISSSSGSVNRGGFVRAAAAAALTLTVAGQRTTSSARAVGVQPGERTTAPPNALLLVPALRAKVCEPKSCLAVAREQISSKSAKVSLKLRNTCSDSAHTATYF